VTNKSVTETFDHKAREAMDAVFDALSAWRNEVAGSTERYSATVFDKMAAAATAMGWPKELVEAPRMHLVQASKMQMLMIDQLVDAWQGQLKSPIPGQFIAQLQSHPGAGSPMANSPMAPVQFWVEAAEAWQRNWASALSMWTGQAGGRARDPATRPH
jgi:hypothetical protein